MAHIEIDCAVLGVLGNNVYYIGDGEHGLLVDPSCKPERINEMLAGRPVDAIVLTHYHFDHIGAALAMRTLLCVPVYASELDAPFIEDAKMMPHAYWHADSCPVDVRVAQGDVVRIGALEWNAMMTPGHSAGSMCWHAFSASVGDISFGRGMEAAFGEQRALVEHGFSGILISGDTLFAGTHGRTDFEGGSPQAMQASLRRLAQLHDDTLVLPGHGAFTTIVSERGRVLP